MQKTFYGSKHRIKSWSDQMEKGSTSLQNNFSHRLCQKNPTVATPYSDSVKSGQENIHGGGNSQQSYTNINWSVPPKYPQSDLSAVFPWIDLTTGLISLLLHHNGVLQLDSSISTKNRYGAVHDSRAEMITHKMQSRLILLKRLELPHRKVCSSRAIT